MATYFSLQYIIVVNATAGVASWVVGGDYNRLPASMAAAGRVVNPPNYPTYPATAPTSALDYSVKSGGAAATGTVLALQMADHLPVSYTY